MTWHQEAACVGHPVDWWFPTEADRSAERWDAGRLVCRSCPVREQCLAESLQDEAGKPRSLLFGMRGGLSPAQRERVSRGLPAELPGKEKTPRAKPHNTIQCPCTGCVQARRVKWRRDKERRKATDPNYAEVTRERTRSRRNRQEVA